MLANGLAPVCCYKNPDDKNNLWLAQRKLANLVEESGPEKSGQRWYYEIQPMVFTVLDQKEDVNEYHDLLENSSAIELSKKNVSLILTKPFDSLEEYTLGVGLMPITQRILM